MFLVKKLKKNFSGIMGSRILLKSNEIKHINKINSLQNRRILLNWTTRSIIIKQRGLLNLLGPLTRAGLSLMKNMPTSLVKVVDPTLGVIQKKNVGWEMTAFIISKGYGSYHENSQISSRIGYIDKRC